MEQMTAAYFLKDFVMGGGPRAVRVLCQAMPQIRILVYGQQVGEMREEFLSLSNVELRPVSGWNPVEIWRIYRELQREHVSIIHFHHLLPAFFFIPFSKIPKIITLHGLYIRKYDFVKAPLYRACRRLRVNMTLWGMQGVVVLCHEDHDYMKKVFYFSKDINKVSVIPNVMEVKPNTEIIELPKFEGLNLLFVARYDYQKGLDLLAEMIKTILCMDTPPRVPFRIYLIGDEEMRELTEGTKGYMKYLGKTLSPYAHMKAADYLLLPSRWEGLPMVALEALSVGTKVIAAHTANLNDFADGENIVTYELGNEQDFLRVLDRAYLKKGNPVTFDISLFSPACVGKQMMELYMRHTSNRQRG